MGTRGHLAKGWGAEGGRGRAGARQRVHQDVGARQELREPVGAGERLDTGHGLRRSAPACGREAQRHELLRREERPASAHPFCLKSDS